MASTTISGPLSFQPDHQQRQENQESDAQAAPESVTDVALYPKTHLMGIPLELRRMILKSLLKGVHMKSITETKRDSDERKKGVQSILFVNRQLREEAGKVYFEECIFDFKSYHMHSKHRRSNAYHTRTAIQKAHITWNPPPSSNFVTKNLQPSFLFKMEDLKQVVIDCKGLHYMNVPYNKDQTIERVKYDMVQTILRQEMQFPRWLRKAIWSGERNYELRLIFYFAPGSYSSRQRTGLTKVLLRAEIDINKEQVLGLEPYSQDWHNILWSGIKRPEVSRDCYMWFIHDKYLEQQWQKVATAAWNEGRGEDV